MRRLLSLACAGFALSAQAAALDTLRAFNADVRSASAQFTQVVVDQSGRRVQEGAGTLVLSRPGKFRWTYDRPYRQLIVGDGQRVWIYDEDLNQVTVRKIDQALGATPAALLSGAQDIEKAFVLTDGGASGGLEWLGARPIAGDSPFTDMRIGFEGTLPVQIELVDNFGQRTTIRLSGFEKNPSLPPDLFRFTPPPGADVVGDRPL